MKNQFDQTLNLRNQIGMEIILMNFYLVSNII